MENAYLIPDVMRSKQYVASARIPECCYSAMMRELIQVLSNDGELTEDAKLQIERKHESLHILDCDFLRFVYAFCESAEEVGIRDRELEMFKQRLMAMKPLFVFNKRTHAANILSQVESILSNLSLHPPTSFGVTEDIVQMLTTVRDRVRLGSQVHSGQ